MKKYLAIAALATIAGNTATAANLELTAEVDSICAITSTGGVLDLVSDSQFSIEYSCNVQPVMTLTSANKGLVAEGSDSVISYQVNVGAGADGLFNSFEFISSDETTTQDGLIPTGLVTTSSTIGVFENAEEAAAAAPGTYSDILTFTVEVKG